MKAVGPVVAGLVFFFLQKDLGPALLITCVFLAVYTVARKRVGMAAIGVVFLVFGFYVGYALNVSPTLAARVQIWLSPWDNAVRPSIVAHPPDKALVYNRRFCPSPETALLIAVTFPRPFSSMFRFRHA